MPPEMFSDLGTKRKCPMPDWRCERGRFGRNRPYLKHQNANVEGLAAASPQNLGTRPAVAFAMRGRQRMPPKLGSLKRNRRIRAEPCGFESLWHFMGTEPTPRC